MRSIVIIIIAAAGFLFLLNYLNPNFDDHKAAISTEIELDDSIWENLEYKDFFVASFTSDASKRTMVTFGLCKYVKVVDEEWIDQASE